jgi:hypothetical protein
VHCSLICILVGATAALPCDCCRLASLRTAEKKFCCGSGLRDREFCARGAFAYGEESHRPDKVWSQDVVVFVGLYSGSAEGVPLEESGRPSENDFSP